MGDCSHWAVERDKDGGLWPTHKVLEDLRLKQSSDFDIRRSLVRSWFFSVSLGPSQPLPELQPYPRPQRLLADGFLRM